MIKHIFTTDCSMPVRDVEDNPVQGVDFCHSCGEDLYLMGGQPCPVNPNGHYWIQCGGS